LPLHWIQLMTAIFASPPATRCPEQKKGGQRPPLLLFVKY
jgi:hypothetical protein